MGSYRECRRIRSISLTETFDEEVEAVRAAADAGDFMAYMTAQGGANVPHDDQTVRVARRVANELNAYDEEVKKLWAFSRLTWATPAFMKPVQFNGGSLLLPLPLRF